jgi:single-strand DNA-binding protein
MVNSVIIEGNLTRDAEIKYSNSGTAIASLSLAFNDNYKKGTEEIKQTSFFDVVAFKDVALSCASFTKGNAVHVEGKLVQDRWDKDGKVQSRVKIIAFQIDPMFRNGGAPKPNVSSPRPSSPNPRPVAASASPASGDDTIPF